MKIGNNQGFTLFETLLTVMILGSVSAGVLLNKIEENKKIEQANFINDAYNIVKAVDHRIAIDGYDPDLWSRLSWSNKDDIVNSLIKKELTSKFNTKCSGGEWEPKTSSENETKLIDCNLWENKKNNEKELNAEIRVDSVGFIQGFDLFISFKNEDNFKSDFRNIKQSLNKIASNENQELSGTHYLSLVSKTTKEDIDSFNCISNPLRCSIKLSYERSGGNEYVRVDGANSMINSHLKFIESKGQSPLKCTRWSNQSVNGTGAWIRRIDEDCGIGIYPETGDAVVVEVVANRGTFKHIVLDKSCKDYEWNGSEVVETGTMSPCGTTTDGTEIYQVIPNITSEKVLSEKIYSSSVLSSSISSKTINVLDKLKANYIESYTGNNIDIYSEMTIKEILNAEKDAYISGFLEVDGDILSKSSIVSTEELKLEKVNVEKSYCATNGSISRLADGGLLSCVSNKWISTVKDTTPIGTIALWVSTSIPEGWAEMRGQSTSPYPELRTLIGNTIPDMRGRFARGWSNGSGIDYGRGLGTYQNEALNGNGLRFRGNPLPAHSHGLSGGRYAFLPGAHGATSGGPYGTGPIRINGASAGTPTGTIIGSGTETRPTNVSLIYIIKVKN